MTLKFTGTFTVELPQLMVINVPHAQVTFNPRDLRSQ